MSSTDPPPACNSTCSARCAATSRACTDCHELHSIEKEIGAMKDLLRDVHGRRSALLEKVNSREDILTSKLPLEIACHVFEEFLKMHEEEPVSDILLTSDTRVRYFSAIHRGVPLRLGSICRKWRNIAWSHSQLWKTLVVTIACPGYELGPAMVYEWLERSGSQKLLIQVDGIQYNRSGQAYKQDVKLRMLEKAISIIGALNRVGSRWHSLDLSECPFEILSELDDSNCTTPSTLQHLILGGQFEMIPMFDLQLPIFANSGRTHSPTHLSLLSAILPPDINISWRRMTDIFLEDMTCANLFHLIEYMSLSAPALHHLSVRLIGGDPHDVPINHAQNIQLPLLQFLSVYEDRGSSRLTADLFGTLTLPALRSLIHDDGGRRDMPFRKDVFIEFVRRSQCQLSTLKLSNPYFDIDIDDLRAFLCYLPALQVLHLKLGLFIETGDFFDWLDQHRTYFPQLQQFLPILIRLDIEGSAPRSWMSFILMFAKFQEGVGSDFSYIATTRPVRHALQLTFTIKEYEPHNSMDLKALTCLALLWTKYEFFVVFKMLSSDGLEKSFLEESFNTSVASVYDDWRSHSDYTSLHKTLVTMSSLKF